MAAARHRARRLRRVGGSSRFGLAIRAARHGDDDTVLAMADEKPLKSSFELAMERLRKSDADAGITQVTLTDAQKAAIAEIRNFYEAKIAQEQVLHDSKAVRTMDPAERDAIDQQYRRERERLADERDRKIEKIRAGEKP
jgi:hypothetical protein